jgi:hypothetical protein
MPRPPLAVGTFGAINFLVVGKGRVRAQVSFRDFDGRRRSVSRYGRTKAEAERRLSTATALVRSPAGIRSQSVADSFRRSLRLYVLAGHTLGVSQPPLQY